jgi:tRNA U54 and U55 pseudouridine synthase Pus10
MTSPLAHRTQTSSPTLIVAAEHRQIELANNKGAINSKWARRERAVALTKWISDHPFQLAVTITFKRSIQGRAS